MKNTIRLLVLIFVIFFSINSWGQKIVYPWRSTTAIVKAGETFEVWFNADAGQTINEISLRGPFNVVSTTIEDTKTDTWIYDNWSENTCNRRITVRVPADSSMDRYDLILKTSTGDEISLAAVKVIKEYKSSYYIMHFSDVHRWQGTYDTPGVILREVSTIVDIANIIDPEMIIETGDNHYQNTTNEATSLSRIEQYMNGYIGTSGWVNGMNNFFAPVFTVPGNHDTPLRNFELEPGYPTPGYEKNAAKVQNKFYGLQNFNFSYGNTRFMGVNNSWTPDTGGGKPGYVANYQWQLDAANAWLSTVGSGKFRISFCHVPQESIPPVYNAFKNAGNPLGLMLAGHVHSITNSPFTYDSRLCYTTLSCRDGSKSAPFNLYKVDDIAGTYETVGNAQSAHNGLETAKNYSTSKLKLSYANANDGTSETNVATIVNKFTFPITGARVRFVVPKGSPYYVTNATIKQEFDGTNFHIIDATYNLAATSTTVVNLFKGIQVDLCPNDPDKMEPGICGCGVPEETCPIPVTGVLLSPSNAKMNTNTDRQLFATVQPSNATNKSINWTSSDTGIATVDTNGLVTANTTGTTTITATTVDGNKTANSTITVITNNDNYQAEDAEFNGPIIATNQLGYNGTGFLDYSNATADYIKWNVYVSTTGNYNLNFRYAASSVRGLKLTINGVDVIASVPFPSTGSFANWGNYSTSQLLNAGNNTITLTAIGNSGGNFDDLTISSTLGVNDNTFESENKTVRVYPNPASDGIITVATDGFDDDTNNRIIITNSTGQKVFEKKLNDPCHTDVNLAGKLSNGVYFVTVQSDQAKITKKLIVKQ